MNINVLKVHDREEQEQENVKGINIAHVFSVVMLIKSITTRRKFAYDVQSYLTGCQYVYNRLSISVPQRDTFPCCLRIE